MYHSTTWTSSTDDTNGTHSGCSAHTSTGHHTGLPGLKMLQSHVQHPIDFWGGHPAPTLWTRTCLQSPFHSLGDNGRAVIEWSPPPQEPGGGGGIRTPGGTPLGSNWSYRWDSAECAVSYPYAWALPIPHVALPAPCLPSDRCPLAVRFSHTYHTYHKYRHTHTHTHTHTHSRIVSG